MRRKRREEMRERGKTDEFHITKNGALKFHFTYIMIIGPELCKDY